MPRTAALTPEQFTSFGELLKFLRRRAGLSQRDLSIAVGYSDSQISRLEQNQRAPDAAAVAARFVSALDLEHERVWVARLLELAATRPAGEPAPREPEVEPALHNLPFQLSSFIGREREVTELTRLLSSERLVTLTGVGGVGKTRLALQVAMGLVHGYPDGVWLVELAPLSDPTLVPARVAGLFGLRDEPGWSPTETLTSHLRSKDLLLILDNCEHLIEACARLAEAVVQQCLTVRVLATSREALGIMGERNFSVPSLSVPDPSLLEPGAENVLAALNQYESVCLLVERALEVSPRFAVTLQNATTVAQVCRRLDGIPLAIELAAARLRMLPVEQIAARLDDRFRLLTGGSRTALPRQQTLRGAIDWSYSLLTAPEQILLRRLAVFAGGCTLEAAQAVCSGEELDEYELIDLLAHLVDKSLVVAEERAGSARYRMLETIRQYAREKLLDTHESKPLHDRHLTYFVTLGLEAEPKLLGRELAAWLDRLEAEIDNIRTALGWARETGQTEAGLQLAAALIWLWNLRGYQAEGLEWLQSLLELAAPIQQTAVRGRALQALAQTHYRRSNYDAARLLWSDVLAIGQALHDQQLVALAYTGFGLMAVSQGDYTLARSMCDQSLALWQASGDLFRISEATLQIGLLALQQGEYAQAVQLFAEGSQLARQIQNMNVVSAFARHWGYALLLLGDDQAAATKFRESLTLNWELGDRQAVGACFTAFAALAVEHKEFQCAVMLLGATNRVCELLQATLLPWDQPFHARYTAAARAQLSASNFNAGWDAGRALTFEQAIALALKEPRG